jgi:hypothetical protein
VTVAEGRGAPVELALPDADGLTVRFQNARGEPLPLVIDNHGALIPLSLAVEMGLAKVVTAGTVVVDLRQ